MVKIPMYYREPFSVVDILQEFLYFAKKVRKMTEDQKKWLLDRDIEIKFETTDDMSFLVLSDEDGMAFKLAFRL